jgi:RNA polymerase sigma-70 factor (ECF subfamily)
MKMTHKNHKTLSDEQLVRLLQNDNRSAMAGIYARHYMVVFKQCMSFVKDSADANDLTQDVMLKIMEKIGSFKGDSRFSTWLYAITFNYCTDFIRKQKKHWKMVENRTSDQLVDYPMEFEDPLLKEKKVKKAQQAMQLIPNDDQELLLQKYQMNKSIRDLQKTYNLSASAVKMRLLRAREKANLHYSKLLVSAA